MIPSEDLRIDMVDTQTFHNGPGGMRTNGSTYYVMTITHIPSGLSVRHVPNGRNMSAHQQKEMLLEMLETALTGKYSNRL